jgi:hypothetical protein
MWLYHLMDNILMLMLIYDGLLNLHMVLVQVLTDHWSLLHHFYATI